MVGNKYLSFQIKLYNFWVSNLVDVTYFIY